MLTNPNGLGQLVFYTVVMVAQQDDQNIHTVTVILLDKSCNNDCITAALQFVQKNLVKCLPSLHKATSFLQLHIPVLRVLSQMLS